MSSENNSPTLAQIEQFTPEQRLKYLLKEVLSHQQIWILTDDDGCVMLNSDDEDCAPVWPSQELAQAWATGEWQDCQPKAISLQKWHSHWTSGLEDDDVYVAVSPSQDQEGLIISSQELDFELKQQARKPV